MQRSWQVVETQTKRLTQRERIGCIVGYIGLLLFAICISCYFASMVNNAAKSPQLAKSIVKLETFPDFHLILVEGRFCYYGWNRGVENWASCEGEPQRSNNTDVPPFPSWPQYDFALGHVLTVVEEPYGEGFNTHRQFIRPAPETVKFSEISKANVEYGGDVDGEMTSILETRIASFPFPINFQKAGSFPRGNTADCMDYNYADGEGFMSFSGSFGKCNESWAMDMFALNSFFNWSTCSVGGFSFGTPEPNCTSSEWVNRFQRNSSWPANFFLLPVASSGSDGLFAEVQQFVEAWSKRANATMAQNPKAKMENRVDPRVLTWELKSAFPQGVMMSNSNPTNGMRKVTLQASSCQGLRCTSDDRNKISATISKVAGLASSSLLTCNDLSSQNPLRQSFTCATANITLFGSVFSEEMVTGSLTFDWAMALGQIQSYVHAGFAVLGFLFPTIVYAGIHYRFGRKRPAWPDDDAAIARRPFIDVNDSLRNEGDQESANANGGLSSH